VPDVTTLKAERWQFDPPLTTSFERDFSALTSAIRNRPGLASWSGRFQGWGDGAV